MTLSRDAIISSLCATLRVNPEQVIFKRDDVSGVEYVELVLHDSQMDWALRDNGRRVRQAAMDLGIDIEIGAAESDAAGEGLA